jgi:hypothetical protein
MKNGLFKKAGFTFIFLVIVFIIFMIPTWLHKNEEKEKMPGKENTYRVVTLYDSGNSESLMIYGNVKELSKEYEGLPEFVYIDLKVSDETGNLKLMAGKNYTVYFLDKNDEIKTMWYENKYEHDEFVTVIDRLFGLKPKE